LGARCGALPRRCHSSATGRELLMSVAKTTEIIASSPVSFEDAIRVGIDRATKTLENVRGAWVSSQKVMIEDNRITGYRVTLKVTFILR
jgi:hypothetical protein